jgi:holo-[acyl-carrier protein] synthase
VGIGVDVVDLERFQAALQRTPALADRLFTPEEQVSARGHRLAAQSLAGRFAVKEAVAKALGAPHGLSFHDCQVSSGGQPQVTLSGPMAQAAQQQGVARWHASISHDGPVAVAYVIAESA